jgi:hypothetical protein
MFAVLAAGNESAPRLRIVSNEANEIDAAFTDDLFEVPAFLSRA